MGLGSYLAVPAMRHEGLIEPSRRRAADDDVASQKLEAHPVGPEVNGPALPIIDHLKARSVLELHDVARADSGPSAMFANGSEHPTADMKRAGEALRLGFALRFVIMPEP